MDGRVASLDDLPPSVVLPISEAARCSINVELRRLDNLDHVSSGIERTVVSAFVLEDGGAHASVVEIEYERHDPFDGHPTRYVMQFRLRDGCMLHGPIGTGWAGSGSKAKSQPAPKPWYHTTGKADYDYENAP